MGALIGPQPTAADMHKHKEVTEVELKTFVYSENEHKTNDNRKTAKTHVGFCCRLRLRFFGVSGAAPHLGMCAQGFQSSESGKQNLGMTLSWSSASLDSRDDFSN